MNPRTIYLTGSDRHDFDLMERKSWHCAKQGFRVILPAEHDIPLGTLSPLQHGNKIAKENIARVKEASLLVVNISPTEGLMIDSDTASEIALACNRGTPVFAYTSVLDIFDTGNNITAEIIKLSGGSLIRFKAPREDGIASMAAFEKAVSAAQGFGLPKRQNHLPLSCAA